jgi:5-methylcytosine-specific restriction endonuclease McrA
VSCHDETIQMIPRPCIVKYCPEQAHIRGRCLRHSKDANLRHNNAHTEYQTKEYRRARELCLARCYYQCLHCGRTRKLHCHHIDHNRSNNSPENLMVLCESCHMTYESDIGNKNAAIQTTIDEYSAHWKAMK